MRTKASLKGHPIHPMLIGFPIAFYAATLVSFIIYGASDNIFWFRVGFVANVAAVATALVAAVPGVIDYMTSIHRKSRAWRDATIHMGLNVSALALFVISLVINIALLDNFSPTAAPGILFPLVGLGLTGAAGWFGWRLVQSHHVGVIPQAGMHLVHDRRVQQIPVAVERRRQVAA